MAVDIRWLSLKTALGLFEMPNLFSFMAENPIEHPTALLAAQRFDAVFFCGLLFFWQPNSTVELFWNNNHAFIAHSPCLFGVCFLFTKRVTHTHTHPPTSRSCQNKSIIFKTVQPKVKQKQRRQWRLVYQSTQLFLLWSKITTTLVWRETNFGHKFLTDFRSLLQSFGFLSFSANFSFSTFVLHLLAANGRTDRWWTGKRSNVWAETRFSNRVPFHQIFGYRKEFYFPNKSFENKFWIRFQSCFWNEFHAN